jgi:hypothetical protein
MTPATIRMILIEFKVMFEIMMMMMTTTTTTTTTARLWLLLMTAVMIARLKD